MSKQQEQDLPGIAQPDNVTRQAHAATDYLQQEVSLSVQDQAKLNLDTEYTFYICMRDLLVS